MKVIASALLFLLLAAGINVVVDPLGMFFVADLPRINRYKPEVLNYWRTTLGLRAHLVRPEAVVLGSSRVLAGIEPADPAFKGANTFNMGLPGATLCEVRDGYEIALAGGRLRQVVIGLDFFAANAQRIGPDCGLREEKDHPWRLLAQTLLSSDTLNASLKTATKQNKVDPAIWQPSPDGHARLHPDFALKKGGPRAMFAEMERVYAKDYYLLPPVCSYQLALPGQTASLDYLRQVLVSAHANNVEVRMFFSPEHARMLGVIEATGLQPMVEAWMREVLRVNQDAATAAKRPPFVIAAPYAADWLGEALPPAGDTSTRMRWMLDGSHYTPQAGSAMLARLMVATGAPDVGREIAQLKEVAERYFSTRPQERAEITQAVTDIRGACKS
jgi:hypothetical protein